MSYQLTADDRFAGYALTFTYASVAALNDEKATIIEKSNCMGMAVMNALGCIPGVSMIVGIARIIFSQFAAIFTENSTYFDEGTKKALQEAQMVRGILECCSIFAELLIISDIALTVLMIAAEDS